MVSQEAYPNIRLEREVHTLIRHGYKVTFVGKLRDRRGLVFGKKYENFKCVEVHIPGLVYSLLEPWLSRTIRRIKIY